MHESGPMRQMPLGMMPPEPKHSGLGIASFVVGLLALFGLMAAVGYAGFLVAENPALGEDSPEMIKAGFLLMGDLLVAIIGITLGAVSLFARGAKKLFGILGLVFSGLTALVFVLLVLVGAA